MAGRLDRRMELGRGSLPHRSKTIDSSLEIPFNRPISLLPFSNPPLSTSIMKAKLHTGLTPRANPCPDLTEGMKETYSEEVIGKWSLNVRKVNVIEQIRAQKSGKSQEIEAFPVNLAGAERQIRLKTKPNTHSSLHTVPRKSRNRRSKVIPLTHLDSGQLASIYTILSHELSLCIVRSNGVMPSIPCDTTYKVFIGPGNNSHLIAFLIKRRWFWTRVDTWQQADFVWTQHRSKTVIKSLEIEQNPVKIAENETKFPVLSTGNKAIIDIEREKSGISLISSAKMYSKLTIFPEIRGNLRIYNRIERNFQLTSKKRLFLNMKNYYQRIGKDVFSYLPLTFLVTSGKNDVQFSNFRDYFHENPEKSHNLWIIKPGECTNCGNGIQISSNFQEIEAIISNSESKHSYIVQKYIEKPLLVHRRKFDIRCYGLCSCFNGHVQGYFYQEGYLRTSSKEFSLKNAGNRFIHLTNDAVQKKSEDYGKFEGGNKMSYPEFQRYLSTNLPIKVDFWSEILPQMRELVRDTYRATHRLLDPKHRKQCFEVLGYDFMIDEQLKVWLIEVNTNPCLELSSTYLARLIPQMLDNAFRIVLDPYFPEPVEKKQLQWTSQVFQNRFELVFSSTERGETGTGDVDVSEGDDG